MTLGSQMISAHMKNSTLVRHPTIFFLSLTNRLLRLPSTCDGVRRVRWCRHGDSEVNTIANAAMAVTEGEMVVFCGSGVERGPRRLLCQDLVI